MYAAYERVAHTRNRHARFPATFLLCRAELPAGVSTTPARLSDLPRHPAPFAWCSPAVTVPCAALTSPAQWGAPPDVRRLDDRWLDVLWLDVRRAANRAGCRRRIANRMIRRRGPCRSCRAVPSDSGLQLWARRHSAAAVDQDCRSDPPPPTRHLRHATSDMPPPTCHLRPPPPTATSDRPRRSMYRNHVSLGAKCRFWLSAAKSPRNRRVGHSGRQERF